MARIIPAGYNVNKQKVLDDIWEFNNWLLYQMADSSTEQEYVKGWGYDNLEDLLEDNYGYQEERLKKAIFLIRQYYQTIRPGDVIAGGKMNVEGYKNVELYCPQDGELTDCFIVATKF